MQLFKYISKVKFAVIWLCIATIYVLLNLIQEKSAYSFFQHPFLTILVLLGFLLLIVPFDVHNSMLLMRFKSVSKCFGFYISQLAVIALLYLSCIFATIIVLGSILHDDFTFQKIFLYLFCTFFSLILLIISLVVFSIKLNHTFSKAILFCIIGFSFSMNFAGELYVKMNVYFYNIHSVLTLPILLQFIFAYAVGLFMIFLVSLKPQGDLV